MSLKPLLPLVLFAGLGLASVITFAEGAACTLPAAEQASIWGGQFNGKCRYTRYDCPDPTYASTCKQYGMWCYQCSAENVPYSDCKEAPSNSYYCKKESKSEDIWCGVLYWGKLKMGGGCEPCDNAWSACGQQHGSVTDNGGCP